MDFNTACRILNISKINLTGNTNQENLHILKKSYHKLALKHHPDKGGDPSGFKEIKEAYDFLIAFYNIKDNDTVPINGTYENLFVNKS